jgi:hypothetical protein
VTSQRSRSVWGGVAWLSGNSVFVSPVVLNDLAETQKAVNTAVAHRREGIPVELRSPCCKLNVAENIGFAGYVQLKHCVEARRA